jgi:hypothetical protein
MNLDSPVSLGGMMVTPSASHEEIKSQNNIEDIYIIEENNNKYEFTLKLIDDKLNIENKTKLKEGEERIYINSFNFEELKSINKFFFICNNINDALNYIKNILEEKKVSIQTITDEEILINLKLKVIKEEAIIKIKLLRKEDSQNDLLNELNLVKKENKDLKERFEKIEKYMNEIDKKRSLRGEKTIKDISDETIFFPSKIIIDEYDKLLILRKLEGKNKKVQAIDLLFRSSRDGDNLENIKKAIDKRKNVLAVLKTTKGRRFAGFTEKGYNFSRGQGEDENAFLISFDNYRAYDYEKYVLKYQIGFYFIQRDRNTYSSVFNSYSCPFFFQNNGNIYIPNNFYSKNCKIERVECPKWNQIMELNLNEEEFNIKELEYFQIHIKE